MALEVEALIEDSETIAIPDAYERGCHSLTPEQFGQLYQRSLQDPEGFWGEQARDLLDWHTPFTRVRNWKLPHAKWFEDGTLNISYNCLDRHLAARGDKTALVYVGEDRSRRTYTFAQLHDEVSRFACGLHKLGVRKGDRVAIYLPMIPEAAIAMLACTRIGAIHSVVFAGFSAESLRHRIEDAGATFLVCANGCQRRGKLLDIGAIVEDALSTLSEPLKAVVGVAHASNPLPSCITHSYDKVCADGAKGMDAIPLAAEHPSFILYTSGTTGKPKGIQHSTGGYLLGAALTTRYVFDVREDDIFWCTADVGWITGHSYSLYGALANGMTSVIYEGAPDTPDWGSFWQIVQDEKVSVFYTAPTAIRAFMKAGDSWPEQYDLSSLRLLGSVGEPINPAAWKWYFDTIGGQKCPIVDTWWQTETGSICLTTLPGTHSMKPGAAGFPFFGIETLICEEDGSPVADGEGGFLALTLPWPSMIRTIWGDDPRFVEQYWSLIEGAYATGDGAVRDKDGFIWVMGRVDDVMNVSGHRLGTMELESVLVGDPAVVEAAVVGRHDDLKGQAPACFVIVGTGVQDGSELVDALRQKIAREIGKFARPDDIWFVPALPKTRSGKIMRRVLRAIAEGKDIGDVSTLEDPATVQKVQEIVRQAKGG